MQIVMLLYPGLTQLDLTGPFEVFTRVPGASIALVARSVAPVKADSGLILTPTHSFADCPNADILFVPGGPGQLSLMDDAETLAFIRMQAEDARFVTSVCTGSLVLAAAGLLSGYRATCHWLSLDMLTHFGCVPVRERVVTDRNRITGGGVTAGIDFALTLVATLKGETLAKAIQLSMEYAPSPPFRAGTPDEAGADIVALLKNRMAGFLAERDNAARRAAARLKLS